MRFSNFSLLKDIPYLLLLCCLRGASFIITVCTETLGHSEGAQPSVISMYPSHEKLEYTWNGVRLTNFTLLLGLLMCVCLLMCVSQKKKHTQAQVRVHR